MAATAAGRRAVERHRVEQLELKARALRDLQRLWRTVDPTNLERTIDGFANAAAVLIYEWREESIETSARYVDELRRAEGAGGAITVMVGDGPSHAELVASIRGAALAGIVRARRRGQSVEAAARGGFVRASGTASALFLAGGREAVASAIHGDDQAVAWMRVTSGDPCEFCAMLASRGPVFTTAKAAAEPFHDHCGCTVEPVYDRRAAEDRSTWPEATARFREIWDHMTGGADVDAGGGLAAFRRGLEAAAKGEPLPAADRTVGIEEF